MTAVNRQEITPTVVTYPSGSLSEVATIVSVVRDGRPRAGRPILVVTDRTPFHPLDPLWPDQSDDRGWIGLGGHQVQVGRVLAIAQRPGAPVVIDDQIDVRRDEPGVVFRVVHAVYVESSDPNVAPGERAVLTVHGQRRRQLSAAHTACHLLAYALNAATHELWRRPVRTDARGHHDFDRAACVHTHHDVDGSVDQYRLGKSLRRNGFDTARFLDRLPGIIDSTNCTLDTWIAADAVVRIDVEGPC